MRVDFHELYSKSSNYWFDGRGIISTHSFRVVYSKICDGRDTKVLEESAVKVQYFALLFQFQEHVSYDRLDNTMYAYMVVISMQKIII